MLALAAILTVYFPLPWIGEPASDILFAVGCLCVVVTVAMDLSAIRTLRAARTTIMPHRAAEHLVTRGPYSFTRNPIYLGYALVTVGIGLIAGSIWFLIAAPLLGLLIHLLAIRGEERHLTDMFGKRYRDYARRVRRWI